MEAYVYTMIDESTLNELLGALHVCIDLPVQLLDENGRILKYFGKKNTYCQHFSSHFSFWRRPACISIPMRGNGP